jgi:hypothetical protein
MKDILCLHTYINLFNRSIFKLRGCKWTCKTEDFFPATEASELCHVIWQAHAPGLPDFSWSKHTKMGNIYQMNTNYTKRP